MGNEVQRRNQVRQIHDLDGIGNMDSRTRDSIHRGRSPASYTRWLSSVRFGRRIEVRRVDQEKMSIRRLFLKYMITIIWVGGWGMTLGILYGLGYH